MPAAVPLIEENSLRASADGFEVKVRLNWYRSLPLSCVENVRLTVDGAEFAPGEIIFETGGQSHPVDELAGQTGHCWYVQDSAVLAVKKPGVVTPGTRHQVEVEITLRAPYIIIGPGKFLTMPTRYTSSQVAA